MSRIKEPNSEFMMYKAFMLLADQKAHSTSQIAAAAGASKAHTTQLINELLGFGSLTIDASAPDKNKEKHYRMVTPQEHFALWPQTEMQSATVQLRMDHLTAHTISAACEGMSRICIGQFEHASEEVRFSPLGVELCDEVGTQLNMAKALLLGMPSSQSHGIYSEHVHENAKKAWGIYRALRHRLAWDRDQEGGMSVSFDEPLNYKDKVEAMRVYSAPDESGKALVYMEIPVGDLPILRDALVLQSRLESLDFEALMGPQLHLKNASGQSPSVASWAGAAKILEKIGPDLHAYIDQKIDGNERIKAWHLRSTQAAQASGDISKVLRAFCGKSPAEDENLILAWQSATDPSKHLRAVWASPGKDLLGSSVTPLFDLDGEPAMIRKTKPEYSVIVAHPHEPYLVCAGGSHSLQTAIMKASRFLKKNRQNITPKAAGATPKF